MKKKKKNYNYKAVPIGFMRLITLNFKLWGRPTKEGWRRQGRWNGM